MNLFPYQIAAVEAVRSAFGEVKRVCLTVPTGGGKTVIAADVVRRALAAGLRVVWLAHRVELVDQAIATIGDPRVHVLTVQSLYSKKDLPPADLLVIDECHAAIADAYLAIAQRYAGAFVLGLTATPERGDGKGLGGLFDRLIVGAKISELIDLKRLVPAEMHRPDRRLRSNQIAASPSAAYCVRAFGTQAISFTNLVSAAKEHNIGFLEAGIESAVIHGGMDPAERARTLDRFRAGEIKVLNNVFVLTEGLDIPSVETIILARSCGTMGTYIQMVGRALRAHPGKERAIVLDLHGVSHTFGHPQDEVTYSLDGRGIVKSGSTADVNQYCSVCGAISDGEPVCAECGIERATGKAPEVVERPLEKFAFVRSHGDRRATLLRWAKDAKETGKQPGFVYHKYKATFGDTPNWNEIVEAMR